MNIDEAIKILNDNIENCNAWLEDNDTEDIIWWKNQKQAIETILDLYNKEKEKNKELENADFLKDYVSKDKITSILGLEKETTEQTILQYIETLESENARLEDIEDKKVQIEYELVFNKGVKSVEEKIKEKIKEIKAKKDFPEFADYEWSDTEKILFHQADILEDLLEEE